MSGKSSAFSHGWTPAVLWMAMIFSFSSIPGSQFPKVPVPNISSMVHAFEYSVLGILLFRAFSHSFPGKSLFLRAFLAASSALLFGVSDEWHQIFVPERLWDPEDLIVDAIAAVLGILLYVRGKGLLPSKK